MLSKITASNFLSWTELEFEVSSGATLIDGWNEDDQRSEGSGKSAILNAISWCLFGTLPKEANIDDVIKDGETSCQVTLEFDNGDAVVRTRKPNDLYLVKAGATIKGKDASETKSIIEEYIGLNFETFCQSVYFAQNYDKKFLTSGQTDKGKILSSIQNLQIFDKARKEVMDLASLEERKLVGLRGQIQSLSQAVQGISAQQTMVESYISEKIESQKQQELQLQNQIELVLQNYQEATDSASQVEDALKLIDLEGIREGEGQLQQLESTNLEKLRELKFEKDQIGKVQIAIQAKQREGSNLATKHQTLKDRVESLEVIENLPQYIRLEESHKRTKNYEQSPTYIRLNAKQKELEAFLKNPTKDCPSCGTELKNLDTTHVQAELDHVKQELAQMVEQSKQDQARISEEQGALKTQVKDEVQNHQREMEEILKQLGELAEYLDSTKVPDLSEIQKQEGEVTSQLAQIESAKRTLRQEVETASKLEQRRSTYETQVNMYKAQLAQLETTKLATKVADISKDEQKLRDLQDQKNTTQQQLDEVTEVTQSSIKYTKQLDTLKDGFKEIKSYVFTNALNELNYRANGYLNELFEVEANIKFSNDDQKIETKIILDGKSRSLGLLSGGQSRRFNLAVDLALSDIVSSKTTSKLDILIFDEYFKDLSEISMEKSLDLLSTRKSPVILIEHNSIFKNAIDNKYFVRLENGTSREARE